MRPVDFRRLAEGYRALPERDRTLIGRYLEGARRYVLTVPDGAFPDAKTEHWRNIAERAHGAAALAAIAGDWPEELRERCRTESAAFVAEFAAQYRREPLLGNPWQGSWWAAEAGTAAWFLWDRLAPDVQAAVADMVVFHADRIAGEVPKCHVEGDTQAESIAWNCTILALAPNLMPDHPRRGAWDLATKRYAASIFATPDDARDETPGDDGKPVKDWIFGANIHNDFSLENHNRFHIDYVFTCYRFLLQGAAAYRLAGRDPPKAFTHHTADVHEQVLLPCLNGSRFAVYVSDNDWKRYHAWTESPMTHAYVALTARSPLASALEEQALDRAAAFWREFPPDFEYPNRYVCGKAWTPRIADLLVFRLLSAPSPAPLPAAEVEAKLAGVRAKQDVRLITHHTKGGSFRSFFGGPGPVVRHIEAKDGPEMLLPLEADYGVRIERDGKPAAAPAWITQGRGDDAFWALRGVGEVREGFVSLPDETVVILGDAPASATAGAKAVECVVGVEKPHAMFTIHHRGGRAAYRYGESAWDRSDGTAGLDVTSDWINLADRIGWVVVNLSADPATMVLPEPGARGFLRLWRVAAPVRDQRFLVVAFPNQAHAQTEARAAEVKGSYADGVMTCVVPPYVVWANLTDQKATLRLPVGPVEAEPNSIGAMREGKRIW